MDKNCFNQFLEKTIFTSWHKHSAPARSEERSTDFECVPLHQDRLLFPPVNSFVPVHWSIAWLNGWPIPPPSPQIFFLPAFSYIASNHKLEINISQLKFRRADYKFSGNTISLQPNVEKERFWWIVPLFLEELLRCDLTWLAVANITKICYHHSVCSKISGSFLQLHHTIVKFTI